MIAGLHPQRTVVVSVGGRARQPHGVVPDRQAHRREGEGRRRRIAVVAPLGVLRDGMKTEQEWVEIPHADLTVGRGMGALDMVRAIAAGRPHVASGELGYHVLDTLLSAERSAATGTTVTVESTVAPVPLLPDDFDPFAATL